METNLVIAPVSVKSVERCENLYRWQQSQMTQMSHLPTAHMMSWWSTDFVALKNVSEFQAYHTVKTMRFNLVVVCLLLLFKYQASDPARRPSLIVPDITMDISNHQYFWLKSTTGNCRSMIPDKAMLKRNLRNDSRQHMKASPLFPEKVYRRWMNQASKNGYINKPTTHIWLNVCLAYLF